MKFVASAASTPSLETEMRRLKEAAVETKKQLASQNQVVVAASAYRRQRMLSNPV